LTASQASGGDTIRSAIDLVPGGTTIEVDNPGAQLSVGAVLNPTSPGSANLIKTGSGDLNLGGGSNYTGVTEVRQGELTVVSSTALGNSPQVAVSDHASLVLANGVTVKSEVSLSGNGFNNTVALRIDTGSNTITGRVALPEDASINVASSSASLTLSGQVFSPVTLTSLTKEGPGLLTMTGGASNN
jgi:autotransporter-associated beta strand protein